MNKEQTSYSAVLGAVLASQRNQNGIEQSVMAARMGLSQASYSRLESGRSAFTVDQMFQAALALNMDSREFIENFNRTLNRLKVNGVEVKPQIRSNSTRAIKSEDNTFGTFITGAALGGLLVGLLSKK